MHFLSSSCMKMHFLISTSVSTSSFLQHTKVSQWFPFLCSTSFLANYQTSFHNPLCFLTPTTPGIFSFPCLFVLCGNAFSHGAQISLTSDDINRAYLQYILYFTFHLAFHLQTSPHPHSHVDLPPFGWKAHTCELTAGPPLKKSSPLSCWGGGGGTSSAESGQ